MTGNQTIWLIEDSRHKCDDSGRTRCWLTDARLLLFVTGLMLTAASFLSYPYVWTAVSRGDGAMVPLSPFIGSIAGDTFTTVLLEDLMRQGLLKREDRAVFLENLSSSSWMSTFVDRTVDFILVSDCSAGPDFSLADGTLRVGGIIAMELQEEPFDMPPNYRVVYVQRFGSTVVAMRKISHADGNAKYSGMGRRLLTVPFGAEDVLLEPPALRRLGRNSKRAAYNPQWDSLLDRHTKLVFVDVGPPGRARSEDWLKKHYPAATRQQEFEVVRLNVEEEGMEESEGITEWLTRNVREEEYVVMKAGAEVAEEIVREGGIGLVDELFLECSHQWEKARKGARRSRRAYWECLALYGKLRDVGVAVHQWWG